MLQTISPSLKLKFIFTHHNKLKVCIYHAYMTARQHMTFLLYSHLTAFFHLCYIDRYHLLPSYKTTKLPLCKSQFNSYMANELLSIQR